MDLTKASDRVKLTQTQKKTSKEYLRMISKQLQRRAKNSLTKEIETISKGAMIEREHFRSFLQVISNTEVKTKTKKV